MESDKEIAGRTLDLQSRGKDFPLVALPAYAAWSRRKLDDGVSPALIAHLDAMSMFGLPEEVAEVDDAVFDELLSDVSAETGE